MKAGSTSSIDAGEAIVGAPLPNRPSDCIATMPTTPPATNVVVLGFIMANANHQARASSHVACMVLLGATSHGQCTYEPSFWIAFARSAAAAFTLPGRV